MRKLFGEKGIALFMALGLLMIVVVFANVILTIMLNQSRVTGHQVGRIQAYYAGMGGMNLALDNLRSGTWTFDPVNSCPEPVVGSRADCIIDETVDSALVDEDGVTTAVRFVEIVFCPRGDTCLGVGAACNPLSTDIDFCINTGVTYLLHPRV